MFSFMFPRPCTLMTYWPDFSSVTTMRFTFVVWSEMPRQLLQRINLSLDSLPEDELKGAFCTFCVFSGIYTLSWCQISTLSSKILLNLCKNSHCKSKARAQPTLKTTFATHFYFYMVNEHAHKC